MAADQVLVLEGINAYRGPAHVLRGVSLAVRQGETVCLVGRNGAGKTTTMAGIMGAVPVRAGTITFQGQDITRLRPHLRARRGIGFAPDDCGIFPDLTVAENLRIGAWMSVAGRQRGDGPAQGAQSLEQRTEQCSTSAHSMTHRTDQGRMQFLRRRDWPEH